MKHFVNQACGSCPRQLTHQEFKDLRQRRSSEDSEVILVRLQCSKDMNKLVRVIHRISSLDFRHYALRLKLIKLTRQNLKKNTTLLTQKMNASPTALKKRKKQMKKRSQMGCKKNHSQSTCKI